MNYLDSGYSATLLREITPPIQDLSSFDLDSAFEGIDASKLFATGSIKSADGRLDWSLEGNTYIVSDGTAERVRLGAMEDGSYGLRIKDRNGTVIMNITGENNLLQSATGKMQIDFGESEQARWYDEQNLRVLIGKSPKTF